MTVFKIILLLALAALMAWACAASAQDSFYAQLHGSNAEMATKQPTWMGPLIQPDSRLSQSLRLSVSNSYTPMGTQTVNYGNYHTLGLLAGDRVQVNFMAPPYVQNNAAGVKDGFGDTMAEVKYRIASGNAQHGNYTLTAMVAETWPTGSHQNGAETAVYYPTLAAGKMWGRFDVQTTLGGLMPGGKITSQGRQIDWNTTAQLLVGKLLWIDIEENANFNFGGPFNGAMENFLTPSGFYLWKRKKWAASHPVFVFGGGMQIATSRFRTYNHNLIPEMRVLF